MLKSTAYLDTTSEINGSVFLLLLYFYSHFSAQHVANHWAKVGLNYATLAQR